MSTQTVLPFTGVNYPGGVAVDTAGDVFLADMHNNRVLKLAAGSSTQTVLPFTGINNPQGVAVGAAGDVYVADSGNNRVLELAAGSSTQTVLPFTGINNPQGVAVGAAGDVYVADHYNQRVVKLAAGTASAVPSAPASWQTVLPFGSLNSFGGVAVGGAGDVYVTDLDKHRVLKLAAGSSSPDRPAVHRLPGSRPDRGQLAPRGGGGHRRRRVRRRRWHRPGAEVGRGIEHPTVLPFTGLSSPYGVAVDAAGDVYVTDSSSRVLKLAAGSSTQTVLPFTDLHGATGVAVDSAGDVYVLEGGYRVEGGNRVVKLAAGSGTQTVLPFTALAAPRVWRWTPPAPCTSPTPATTGC